MKFKAKNYTLPLNKKTYIMAAINLTPDSFHPDSRAMGNDAVTAAIAAVKNGADIIDLGAQSTAPNSSPITAEEELERLEEPLYAIRKAVDLPISVDTYFLSVAKKALEAGADIINDVSGTADIGFAQLAAKTGAGWIAMHTGGKTSKETAQYENGVINDINLFFDKAVTAAKNAGLDLSQLCLDPGIGFGKSRENDLEIIKRFRELTDHGCATLAALSRKRVTRLGGDSLSGTITANTACILGGANIIRVHDIPQAVATAKTADLIKGGIDLG